MPAHLLEVDGRDTGRVLGDAFSPMRARMAVSRLPLCHRSIAAFFCIEPMGDPTQ
jgi:hypothetical protein